MKNFPSLNKVFLGGLLFWNFAADPDFSLLAALSQPEKRNEIITPSIAHQPITVKIIAVTIAPHKYLVDQIVKELVLVKQIIPSSADMHTFEPTPSQMLPLQESAIWFQLGDEIEYSLQKAYQRDSNNLSSDSHTDLQIISLNEVVELIPSVGCRHVHHDRQELNHEHGQEHACTHEPQHKKEKYKEPSPSHLDPHTWLSPLRLIAQSEKIAEVLILYFPEYAHEFQINLQELTQRLLQRHHATQEKLQAYSKRIFASSHPSFNYFARDYQLQAINLEEEGKELSPKKLEKIISQLKKASVKHLLVEKNVNQKGANRVAEVLGLQEIQIDSHAYDVEETLDALGKALVLILSAENAAHDNTSRNDK